jgi:hypothetical protein
MKVIKNRRNLYREYIFLSKESLNIKTNVRQSSGKIKQKRLTQTNSAQAQNTNLIKVNIRF